MKDTEPTKKEIRRTKRLERKMARDKFGEKFDTAWFNFWRGYGPFYKNGLYLGFSGLAALAAYVMYKGISADFEYEHLKQRNIHTINSIQGTLTDKEYPTDPGGQSAQKYTLIFQTNNGEEKVFNMYRDEKTLKDKFDIGDRVKIDARGPSTNERFLQDNYVFDVRYVGEDLDEKSWREIESPGIVYEFVKIE